MGMCAFLCEQCVCVFYFTFYGLMRSYCWCYFLVTGEIWVYEIFFFCLSCVWLNQIGVAALSVKIDALQKQVSADYVDRALEYVRQLAGRPVGLSDGTVIVAALESLADVSRSAGHVDYKRHEAVLKQCRPLTHDPRLPAVVTQLLGDEENKKIAGQIQKILKSDHLFPAPKFTGLPFHRQQESPAIFTNRGVGVADTLRMVMAVIIISTLVGVSTPLGVIIVVKLGTELPIVPHLSVRNIVLLYRLI